MMSELFGKPIAACPAGCGCLWRDNRDGTMSLFGENSSSCEVCEYATWNELIPLKIDRYSDTLFLSQRLQRVASMVDLKYLEMSDTQVCEVAGTILGEIARKLSELVRERDKMERALKKMISMYVVDDYIYGEDRLNEINKRFERMMREA